MTIGTKSKGTEEFLKFAIAICVLFSLANAAGIVYAHIPPYDAGECFAASGQGAVSKVIENHILSGYSVVESKLFGSEDQGLVGFMELRNPNFKSVECPR